MFRTKVLRQKVVGRNEDNSGDTKTHIRRLKEVKSYEETMAATAEQMDAVIKGLEAVRKEMGDFRQEIKKELAVVKMEFKKELDDQMQRVSGEMRAQGVLITEVQNRVAEVEEWRTAVSEMVVPQDAQVKELHAKVLDLQARASRNCIRVFNCPEAATDGQPIARFLEELIWSSLDLPDGTELNIMKAYRVLAPKPKDATAPPRAIVANFLQFDTKELVLRTAWKTEVKVDGRRIGFDHDYPAEIVKLRKEYIPLKKILKQEGIAYSSPFTKLRVQWPEGTKIYTNAAEAAREIHAKCRKYKERTTARTRMVDSTPRDEETAEPGGETTGDGEIEPVPEPTTEETMEEKEKRRKEAVAKWQRVLRKKTGEKRGVMKKDKEKRQ